MSWPNKVGGGGAGLSGMEVGGGGGCVLIEVSFEGADCPLSTRLSAECSQHSALRGPP